MPRSPLPNYLRAQRKKVGLSQDEVAFLLGTKRGDKVSRYERFRRHPSLGTAMAFEALYQAPVDRLFAGVSHAARKQLVTRTKALTQRLHKHALTPQTTRKLNALRSLQLRLLKVSDEEQ